MGKSIRLPGAKVAFSEEELAKPCARCGGVGLWVFVDRLECPWCSGKRVMDLDEPVRWPEPEPDFVGWVNQSRRTFTPVRPSNGAAKKAEG